MRRTQTLPLTLSNGLVTRFRGEELQASALLRSENADGFGVFRGYGKIPGSSAQVLPAISGVAWEHLAYYEYIDLLGAVTREVLGLNGTVLYQIESDKSVTSLKSGMTSEPMSHVVTSDRIHLTSRNNTPIKYDGNSVTTWGLIAPGSQETVIHAIDNTTNWQAEVSGDTISTSANSKDGDGALLFNKVNTSQSYVGVQTFSGSYDFVSAGGADVYFWLFLPAGGITVARSTAATVEVTIGSGGLNNPLDAYNRYDFNIGNVQERWNLLTFDSSEPDATQGNG